jgi:hypothetical protein
MEAVGIMKISVTWRLLVMIAGALLALAAGLGAAVPASAADIPAAGGSSLSLRVSGNGSYTVYGSGYSAKTVHVWVVRARQGGAVDERTVKPRGRSFSFSGRGLKCGVEYMAVSFSKTDGWAETNSVSYKC